MTVYELDKQATQGPWHSVRTSKSQGHIANKDGCMVSVVSLGIARAAPNTLLTIHCRNNFLRALEALKEEREFHSEQGRAGRADQLNEIIKELETTT